VCTETRKPRARPPLTDQPWPGLWGLSVAQVASSNRLRDALSSVSPARQRVVGSRVAHGGVRDLAAKYPTVTSLKAAGNARNSADDQDPLASPRRQGG